MLELRKITYFVQDIAHPRKQDCELTMLPLLQMVTKEETEEKGSFTDDFISLALP